jgi:hypothetical protein
MCHIREQFIPPECKQIPVEIKRNKSNPKALLRCTPDMAFVYCFMFTFTIIKRGVQQDCKKAWRHIGFIPDLDQRPKSESAYISSSNAQRGRSTRNYHRCWNTLFEEFYKIQNQKEGMNVLLRIGNHVIEVQAFFPVAIIMGDAKSNDTLTCRVPNDDQPRMSRACYTSFTDCCKHDHLCVWVEKEDQEELLKQSAESELAQDKDLLSDLKCVSTIHCESLIFHMDFGNNKYGQFRACTAVPCMFRIGFTIGTYS